MCLIADWISDGVIDWSEILYYQLKIYSLYNNVRKITNLKILDQLESELSEVWNVKVMRVTMIVWVRVLIN